MYDLAFFQPLLAIRWEAEELGGLLAQVERGDGDKTKAMIVAAGIPDRQIVVDLVKGKEQVYIPKRYVRKFLEVIEDLRSGVLPTVDELHQQRAKIALAEGRMMGEVRQLRQTTDETAQRHAMNRAWQEQMVLEEARRLQAGYNAWNKMRREGELRLALHRLRTKGTPLPAFFVAELAAKNAPKQNRK